MGSKTVLLLTFGSTWAASVCSVVLFAAGPVSAAPRITDEERRQIVATAEEAFDRMIERWREGRGDLLYDLGTFASRRSVTRPVFARRIAQGRQPDCCWSGVRDRHGIFRSRQEVWMVARIGYAGQMARPSDRPAIGGIQPPAEETFRLILEEGEWRVSLREILRRASR